MNWELFPRHGFEQEPVPVLLPEPLASDVDSQLGEDRFVEAVRLVREVTELGIVVANRAVRLRQS